MCGFIIPISSWSLVAFTASISTKPRVVFAAINPGYTCFPLAFITEPNLAVVAIALPTKVILPSLNISSEFSMTSPFPKCAVAPSMEYAVVCWSAGVCCAVLFPIKQKNSTLYIIFFIIFSF